MKLGSILAGCSAAETGGDRIDKDEIGVPERRLVVIDNLVRGVGAVPSVGRLTRLGPSAPMCSQTDEEPGPPLKENVSGRRDLSEALSSV